VATVRDSTPLVHALERRVKEVETRCEFLAKAAEIQFRRIAEIQASLDEMRVSVDNVKDFIAEAQKKR
jgi:hypothetical protein